MNAPRHANTLSRIRLLVTTSLSSSSSLPSALLYASPFSTSTIPSLQQQSVQQQQQQSVEQQQTEHKQMNFCTAINDALHHLMATNTKYVALHSLTYESKKYKR